MRLPRLLLLFGVEAGCRLTSRIRTGGLWDDGRLGDPDALAIAFRELANYLFLYVGDTRALAHLVDALANLRRGEILQFRDKREIAVNLHISGNRGGVSGRYPMFFLTSSGCSMTSKPATLAFPAVGGRKQVRTRMVVVLPAPFLPRNPTISPLPTSKEILLTAT